MSYLYAGQQIQPQSMASAITEQSAFSLYDLATRWGVSDDTIRRQMDKGEIEYFKVGSQRRVLLSEILRIESGEKSSTADSKAATQNETSHA